MEPAIYNLYRRNGFYSATYSFQTRAGAGKVGENQKECITSILNWVKQSDAKQLLLMSEPESRDYRPMETDDLEAMITELKKKEPTIEFSLKNP